MEQVQRGSGLAQPQSASGRSRRPGLEPIHRRAAERMVRSGNHGILNLPALQRVFGAGVRPSAHRPAGHATTRGTPLRNRLL